MKIKQFPRITYLEPNTVEIWLSQGAIKPIWYGEENTYYVDEFGIEFYCKNYPNQYGEVIA
jgi:hypothetical protein